MDQWIPDQSYKVGTPYPCTLNPFEFGGVRKVLSSTKSYMAASQNARSGSTPKTHRRSRPPIQTDPDLTIQTYDPDPFVLSSLDIFFYKVLKCTTLHYKVLVLLQYHSVLQSATKYWKVLLCTTNSSTTLYYKVLLCTTKYYSVLQSTTLYYKVLLCATKYYSVVQSTTLYYKVLQSTILGDLVNFGKIWLSRSRPFQTRSRPVPRNPRASVHSQPCCPRRKNRSVRPAQNHLIHFIQVVYEMIIMIPGAPFQTCGKDVLRKWWSFQTSGSPRNDPDPFIDPCPYKPVAGELSFADREVVTRRYYLEMVLPHNSIGN